MKTISLLTVCFSSLVAVRLVAQAPGAAENPVHQELRQLRTNVLEAIASGNVDRQLQYVHTNIVITWQNGDVCRGHQGLRDFYARFGKDAFKGYKVPPTPAELTIMQGDNTGISYGHSVAQYTLFGRTYEFNNHWTATLVKDNGNWKLASYHVSLDALNNPLINAAKKGLMAGAGISCVIGLVIGIVIGRSLGRMAQRAGAG
jgi:hypothetical protein